MLAKAQKFTTFYTWKDTEEFRLEVLKTMRSRSNLLDAKFHPFLISKLKQVKNEWWTVNIRF